MPGSAFIRHTVNNGTARSDDSEAERAASSKSLFVTREREREKKGISLNSDFFSFSRATACFVVRKRLRMKIGSETAEIRGRQSPSKIRGMNGERKREQFLTEHRVCNRRNKNPAARHHTIRITRTLISESSSSFSSYFSSITFIPP